MGATVGVAETRHETPLADVIGGRTVRIIDGARDVDSKGLIAVLLPQRTVQPRADHRDA